MSNGYTCPDYHRGPYMPRFRAIRCVAAFLITLVTGCMSSMDGAGGGDDVIAPPPLVDPVGTWTMTLAWGTGNCGKSGTGPDTEVVVKTATGYALASDVAGVTITGNVGCDVAKCILNADEVDGAVEVLMTLDLNALDQITGKGTVDATGLGACSQVFTATGTFSP